jgi:hypothetical protein
MRAMRVGNNRAPSWRPRSEGDCLVERGCLAVTLPGPNSGELSISCAEFRFLAFRPRAISDLSSGARKGGRPPVPVDL